MSKYTPEKIGTITVISLVVIIGIILFFYLNHSKNIPCELYQISFDCEMSTNLVFLIEVSLTSALALVLGYYFYHRQESFRKKRYNFAINRIRSILIDIEKGYDRIIPLAQRISFVTDQQRNEFNIETRETIISLRRTLESLQGTLHIIFDVIDPMLSTKLDNFTRIEIEFFSDASPENLDINKFQNSLRTVRQILSKLPDDVEYQEISDLELFQ